ncbi:Fe-S cluster assembly protein SufD [Synechococcus sp. CBW1004]|uniref:Fe-S cluster assembly protein SufD n=1 Tax=Synechococcus sp. CBW1004 TaxID=1353136 RepID=UPI0018CFB176|nr:Fe-S cluster assembly protein SufD [Synechococcus sp. CBW1004]QPN63115.1 Fe-S cluster assembly protein SufD [Synechococcus sp. CBW1004]
MVAASLSRPAAAPAWSQALLQALPAPAGVLAPVQQRGRDALAALPLPSRRDEAWRFTPLEVLTALDPSLLTLGAEPPVSLPAAASGTVRLVLDGRGDPLAGVTLPEGLSPLSEAELQQRLGQTLEANGCREAWPVLLNKAAAGQLLALRVQGPVQPVLELVCDAGGEACLLPVRILLVLEAGASLAVLQVHRSRGANLSSVVVEAQLGEGARLQHGLLAHGHSEAALLAHLAVCQEPGSELSLSSATAGWGLLRFEPRVQQAGGQAQTTLRALQLVSGHQLADTHSQVAFEGPEGRLDQLHKVVAGDAGRSVFNGAVRVPRAAQRTDASQLSRSLLLSERARVDTKPELEIVADDVRCAHGATVSQLQQDELFYLQSRGIGADRAAALLLRGYCEEILRSLPSAAAAWQPLPTLLGETTD